MRSLSLVMLMAMALSACASRGDTTPAVVVSETARQAAAEAARDGASPDQALREGEAAAAAKTE